MILSLHKASILTLLIIIAFSSFVYSQKGPKIWLPTEKPLNKLDWDKPGNYEIAANLTKTTLYKEGDETRLEVFITGYGTFGKAKIYFTSSESIFSNSSKIYSGLFKENDEYIYGGDSSKMFQRNSGLLTLQGLKNEETWDYSTLFVDFIRDSSRLTGDVDFIILSETHLKKAPVQFDLKLKENVKPGDYNIILILTYFNGVEWKSSKQTVHIHVNNWLEENPVIAYIISGIIGLGFLSILLEKVVQLFSSFFKKKNKILGEPHSEDSKIETLPKVMETISNKIPKKLQDKTAQKRKLRPKRIRKK